MIALIPDPVNVRSSRALLRLGCAGSRLSGSSALLIRKIFAWVGLLILEVWLGFASILSFVLPVDKLPDVKICFLVCLGGGGSIVSAMGSQ